MQILETIFIIFFIIVSILLILIVLLQSNRSAGMGMFGGGSQSVFGSSSADVLTKMTAILAGIFLFLAISLAYIRSASGGIQDIQKELNQSPASTENQVSTPPAPTPEGQSGTANPALPAP